MIHGHGDDRYSIEQTIVADFSTNVWYGATQEPLVRFLQKRIPLILHYPEPDADSFVADLAEKLGFSQDSILAANGATELFYLIAQAFAGAKTTLFYPSFSEYEDACSLHNHILEFKPAGNLDSMPACDLIILCNPNNPNGLFTSREQIEQLLLQNTERVVVVDESFIEFTRGDNSVLNLVNKYPNLLVIRSMTKSYAIPGLRLGYMVGGSELISRIKRYAFPWRVNVLAVEAGKYLIQRNDVLSEELGAMFERKDNFQAAILRVDGFEPKYSDTTFFLVYTEFNVPELKRFLIDNYGILIRDASNFRGLDEHWFRLNTLNEKRNAMLVEALEQFASIKRNS